MGDRFGNLIKIWGDPTETAVDISARLQDGMLAYCPLEKVAVWRKDATTYERLTSETRVLELIASNQQEVSDTDVLIADPTVSIGGNAHNQQEANQGYKDGITSNASAISSLANVSMSVSSVSSVLLSTSPTTWDFKTVVESNNPAVLSADEVNNVIYFHEASVRYSGQAQMMVSKSTQQDRTLTIDVRRYDNDEVVRTFTFPLTSKSGTIVPVPIPVIPYDNTEVDYGIYYVAYASDNDVTINSLDVNYQTNGSGGNTNPSKGTRNLNMSDGEGFFSESNLSQSATGELASVKDVSVGSTNAVNLGDDDHLAKVGSVREYSAPMVRQQPLSSNSAYFPSVTTGLFGSSQSNLGRYIKIAIPNAVNTMMSFTIHVFSNNNGEIGSVRVGGYNNGSSWDRTNSVCVGSLKSVDLVVSFGHDVSDAPYIVINRADDELIGLPYVSISNVLLGYNGANNPKWETDWGVHVVDDITGISFNRVITDLRPIGRSDDNKQTIYTDLPVLDANLSPTDFKANLFAIKAEMASGESLYMNTGADYHNLNASIKATIGTSQDCDHTTISFTSNGTVSISDVVTLAMNTDINGYSEYHYVLDSTGSATAHNRMIGIGNGWRDWTSGSITLPDETGTWEITGSMTAISAQINLLGTATSGNCQWVNSMNMQVDDPDINPLVTTSRASCIGTGSGGTLFVNVSISHVEGSNFWSMSGTATSHRLSTQQSRSSVLNSIIELDGSTTPHTCELEIGGSSITDPNLKYRKIV